MNPSYCSPNDYVYLRNDEEILRTLKAYFGLDEGKDPIFRMAMGIVRDNDDLFTIQKVQDGYLFSRRIDRNNHRRTPFFFVTDEVAKWLFAFCSRLRDLNHCIIDPLEIYLFSEDAGVKGKELATPRDALRNAMKDPSRLDSRDELALGIAKAMRGKYALFTRSAIDHNSVAYTNDPGLQQSYIDLILKKCTDVELALSYNVYIVDPEKPIEQYGGLKPQYLYVPEEVLEDILAYGWMELWDPEDEEGEEGEGATCVEEFRDQYGCAQPDNDSILRMRGTVNRLSFQNGGSGASTPAAAVSTPEVKEDDVREYRAADFNKDMILHISKFNGEKLAFEVMYHIRRSFVKPPVMGSFIEKFDGCYMGLYWSDDTKKWYYKISSEVGELTVDFTSLGYQTDGISRDSIDVLVKYGFLAKVNFQFYFPTNTDVLPGQYTRDIGWYAIGNVNEFEVGHSSLSDEANVVNVAFAINHRLGYTGTFIRLFETEGMRFYKIYTKDHSIDNVRLNPIDPDIMKKFIDYQKVDAIGVGFTRLPFSPDAGLYSIADLAHTIPSTRLAAELNQPSTFIHMSNEYVMFAHNHPESISIIPFSNGLGMTPVIVPIVDVLTAIQSKYVVPFIKLDDFRYRFTSAPRDVKHLITGVPDVYDTVIQQLAMTYEGKSCLMQANNSTDFDYPTYNIMISDGEGAYHARTSTGPDTISEACLLSMLRDGVVQWINTPLKSSFHVPEGQPNIETSAYLQLGNRKSVVESSESYEDLCNVDRCRITIRAYPTGKALITSPNCAGFYIEPETLMRLVDNECLSLFAPVFGVNGHV